MRTARRISGQQITLQQTIVPLLGALYTAPMSPSATASSPLTLPDDPGTEHACRLLDALGINAQQTATSEKQTLNCWARSGAMWLTGSDQPQPIDLPLAAAARGAFLALQQLSPQLERCFPDHFPPECLLGERAAIANFHRSGDRNCGGSSKLLNTRDGIVALNLPRADDWEQLPALFSRGPHSDWPEAGDWTQLQQVVAQQSSADLVELGHLMGIAVADAVNPLPPRPWLLHAHPSRVAPQQRNPLVIDLSALWAGPLCGSLLQMCGAQVIKVESLNRPDGARQGPRPFYNVLNAHKSSLALDLPAQSGALLELLRQADIVIESSRPRALRQMGIDAQTLLAEKPGMVWVSITGYGRDNELAVAYGDDAGVAAGLSKALYDVSGQWLFCGDAIADPLTGLHAAVAAYSHWTSGHGGLLDISLCAVTQFCAENRPTLSSSLDITHCEDNWWIKTDNSRLPVDPPRARPPRGVAPDLGADTQRVIRERGLSC